MASPVERLKSLRVEESQVSSRKYNMINKVRSTHKELTSKYSRLTTKALGFTMAEILLSLTIIGVVAAITLPSLTGNINERTWNTQRKALYSRMSQAIALMPALNGYGSYSGSNTGGVVTVTEDTAAETFVTSGLAKVLKINNICSNNFADCGLSMNYNNFVGSRKTLPTDLTTFNPFFTSHYSFSDGNNFKNPQDNVNTKAVAFETANGESILTLYNPHCSAHEFNVWNSQIYYIQPMMCVNFIYDLNGKKGPNTIGKDMGFITVLKPTDSIVVAPVLASVNQVASVGQMAGAAACRNFDEESRLPNIDELASIFYNKDLIGFTNIDNAWSSTRYSSTRAWMQDFNNGGYRFVDSITRQDSIRCVKRN